MKIGIDARFFGPIGKGLGRYAQKLIENLEKVDQENDYVIFLRKENFADYVPKSPNFKKVLADYRWYGFGEQLFFPILLYRQRLDVMHFPHFNVPLLYRKKIIVTIHDLILLHFPTLRGTTLSPLWYKIKFLAYKLTIGSALRRARKIIAVSQSTKKDILKNYSISPEKIDVTHEAVDPLCYFSLESTDKVLERYGIIGPYLLYVGNAYPHKNLEKLIEVFARLRKNKSEMNLVLVGKEDFFYRRLKELVEKNEIKGVIFPGFISDEDLSSVYRRCEAYVFPSLYEGFGLPPLEAMLLGVPVLSSDHFCMKEVLGESALFCDAKNNESLLKGLERIIDDQALRKNLIEKGYLQSLLYSWQQMAGQTQKNYQEIK